MTIDLGKHLEELRLKGYDVRGVESYLESLLVEEQEAAHGKSRC
jgi:hypothetical protein